MVEGKEPQTWPQKRLDRRLEVAQAVGGGYCRLQMPLKLALAVRETVPGHRLGALEGGPWLPPWLPIHHWRSGQTHKAPPPKRSDTVLRGLATRVLAAQVLLVRLQEVAQELTGRGLDWSPAHAPRRRVR